MYIILVYGETILGTLAVGNGTKDLSLSRKSSGERLHLVNNADVIYLSNRNLIQNH